MPATAYHFGEIDHCLDDVELLQSVSPEKLMQLTEKCNWIEYRANDIIVDVNDEGTSLFFLVKGKLRVMDFLAKGQEVALAEIKSGDLFGELSAIDLNIRSARVIALEPILLAELPSEEFHKLLIECPFVATALLRRFAKLIRHMTQRLTSMSMLSPHQRIYSELLRLSEPNTSESGGWIINDAPNHQELSSWVGTDRQTVADAIGNLARDGVIQRKHKDLIIKNHLRLQQLIDK